jgi:hypothetical protein
MKSNYNKKDTKNHNLPTISSTETFPSRNFHFPDMEQKRNIVTNMPLKSRKKVMQADEQPYRKE